MSQNQNINQLVGNTPLVRLTNIEKSYGLVARLYAKIERNNPAGSVKDRIAKGMLEDAEAKGLLQPGAVVIEPTSGNTGIGLAALGVARGYRVILTMPETMSIERRNLIKAYGAEIVLTQGSKGMKGAIEKAQQLHEEMTGSFIPDQFNNPANPKAHYQTTGPEIWQAMNGQVDVFVAGVGTGGTISGAGKYLKEKNPLIYIVAVEPLESPVLSQGKAGPHKIQGIGAGFIPKNLDTTIYNEIIAVPGAKAFDLGKETAKKEGILAGISSGAALSAAIDLGTRPEYQGKNMIVVFPDGGDRYFSTALFENW